MFSLPNFGSSQYFSNFAQDRRQDNIITCCFLFHVMWLLELGLRNYVNFQDSSIFFSEFESNWISKKDLSSVNRWRNVENI